MTSQPTVLTTEQRDLIESIARQQAEALVLSTSPRMQRAADHLHEVCAGYRIDPPSVAEVHEYASVAFDVREVAVDPVEWLVDFIDARETIASDRCQSIFRRLDLYAHLDDATAQHIANTSEDARFASPCDPCVLVIVTSSGGAIVADLAGAHVHEHTPTTTRREHRAARRAARRTIRRDRRLHGEAVHQRILARALHTKAK